VQRSPTASPDACGGGEFQEGGGHLCLFPETKASSAEERGGDHRVHRSVSPPEAELEVLDPFLHPASHAEISYSHSADQVQRSDLELSVSPVEQHSSRPGGSPVHSGGGQVMEEREGTLVVSSSALVAGSYSEGDSNSASSSYSSVEDIPVVVTQEIQNDRHGNGGGAHSGDENVEISHDSTALSVQEDTAKPRTLEVGVEVGVTSSSPIESCLYADT